MNCQHQIAGLEWGNEIDTELKNRIDEVPLIEIIPDNFFTSNLALEKTIEAFNKNNTPVIIHSVALSLLSLEPLKKDYFNKVLNVAKKINNVVTFSDHMCMTEFNQENVGQLTTSPYNDETLQVTIDKINQIQDIIGKPFTIENISHPFFIPYQKYTETEFLNKLIDKTGCKVLMDLNNIYTNDANFKIDAYQWINEIDLSLVDSIHLAGGFLDDNDIMQDGHCFQVPQPVWDLFTYTIKKAQRPIATIVERTGNNAEKGMQPIIEDMNKAQRLMDEALAGEESIGATL